MSKLTDVTFTTTLGAVYSFPDVDLQTLEELVRQFPPSGQANVTLTNVSRACLVIPARIIITIRFEGKVQWSKEP